MVEFAIIGVFFALLLVFSADLVVRLAYQGKLDRMSYSAANIIKERTELANADQVANADQADLFVLRPDAGDVLGEFSLLYETVLSSLKRTSASFDENKFGFHLHVVNYDNERNIDSHDNRGIDCQPSKPRKELDFITTFGRHATLYQVTLCYDTPSWYGQIIGQDFSRVSSRSIVMGR